MLETVLLNCSLDQLLIISQQVSLRNYFAKTFVSVIYSFEWVADFSWT